MSKFIFPPSEKGIHSKWKLKQTLPFRADPYQKGFIVKESIHEFTKVVNGAKTAKCTQYP